LRQDVSDVAGAHARSIAQLPLCDGRLGRSQDLFDTLSRGRLIGCGGWGLLDEFESEGRRVIFQGQLQPIGAGCGTMLDIEEQALAVATQIEI
jgi:hypothetical protein